MMLGVRPALPAIRTSRIMAHIPRVPRELWWTRHLGIQAMLADMDVATGGELHGHPRSCIEQGKG